jgi:hypothetical protein
MSGYLFEESPRVGWADLAINLTNAGAHVVGAPEEVRDGTSVAASTTPSSFATSFTSHAGRFAENYLESQLADTDEERAESRREMDQQRQDIEQGRGGAYPLQGIFLANQLGRRALTDDRPIDVSMGHVIGPEAQRGDYGPVVQFGNLLGDSWHDAVDRPGGLMRSLTQSLDYFIDDDERPLTNWWEGLVGSPSEESIGRTSQRGLR